MTCDFLVIGAGIIGLSVAKSLKYRYPDSKIIVIEKELDVAMHASGRNSGVLHAGFYYTADSLKAKFTREGNRRLKEFCYEEGLKVNECGKVVVCRSEDELNTLEELYSRGIKNGVDVKLIDTKELAEIEPNAKTVSQALHSPSTATVDPTEVTKRLKEKLISNGVKIYFNTTFIDRVKDNIIKTSQGNIEAGFIFNTAGLYADRIASSFGYSNDFTIIPFKGIYLKYSGDDTPLKTNIYPVPRLENPFLGVHYTVTVDGTVKIGPTAIPAFGRENYHLISGIEAKDLIEILYYESRLFINNSFHFRDLAFEEFAKYDKSRLAKMAGELSKNIDIYKFTEWSRSGIRAQLLNIHTLELVQDFVLERDDKSAHVLNAVSPAFTCSLPFGEWVVNQSIK